MKGSHPGLLSKRSNRSAAARLSSGATPLYVFKVKLSELCPSRWLTTASSSPLASIRPAQVIAEGGP